MRIDFLRAAGRAPNGFPIERLRVFARWSFLLCGAAIVLLSLAPGSARPHTPLPGWSEHFLAYLIAGLLVAIGSFSSRGRLIACAACVAAAGALEILQNFSPGRSPSLWDALASAGGVTAAQLLWSLVVHFAGDTFRDAAAESGAMVRPASRLSIAWLRAQQRRRSRAARAHVTRRN